GYDELSDAHAARDLEILVTVIDQQHLQFAAIIAVDRAWRVETGDPVPQRQPRTRPHLTLEAVRDLEHEAGRDQSPLSRQKDQWPVLGHCGAQIHARRTRRLVGWRR